MKRLHRKEGFTLIELMIVILIISILVAIAIPVYLAAKSNAQKRTCQANLRTIDGAINTYLGENEVYPIAQELDTGGTMAPYVKVIPDCPAIADALYYIRDTSGEAPEASCTGSGHTYP